ncbi:hypothetical protein LGH82_18945 [Mesorhizobium sp. PAMC28654]|uniref:hypothetical protein n=1 Tax=Mesorhizobium sp. PAMC28654 TaxID=2880934 RepID=UPI001D09BD2C|nr:hypothetical protein [Mesorhizobium sp. PAMC28654]UDL87272.1 hypothetical protein LGH82_18945 [Mesorhizobium sp. PAMC28654]
MDIPRLSGCQYLELVLGYTVNEGYPGMPDAQPELKDGADPLKSLLLDDPEARLEGGLIAWKVEEGHGEHLMDLPFYLFLKIATLHRGTVYLGSNRSDKDGGEGKHYLVLKLNASAKFSVDRLIANAEPRQRVRESLDHHRHLRNELRLVSGALEGSRTSKFNLGRQEAIEAVLVNFDWALAKGERTTLDHEQMRSLMLALLEMADNASVIRTYDQQAA